MLTRTYNIRNLIVNWGGIIFAGWGQDAVEVSQLEDDWNEEAGADGYVVRSANLNQLGEFKAVLSAASPTQDLISARAVLDKATGLPVYSPALQVGYFGSANLVFAERAWLKKPPTQAYGKAIGDREFVFRLNPMVTFTGGLVI